MKKRFTAWLFAVLSLLTALGGVIMLPSCSAGPVFYISADGDDSNSGTSPNKAWKSFANVNSMYLEPGTKILLRRGDVWNERLVLRGMGAENAWITVSDYGDARMKPRISLNCEWDDICILVTDLQDERPYSKEVGYIKIENLDIRNSMLGIYVRSVLSENNQNLIIQNCDFSNMTCHEMLSYVTDLDTMNEALSKVKGNLLGVNSALLKIEEGTGGANEYLFPAAVWFGNGGQIFKNVKVSGLTFDNCLTGVGGQNIDGLSMTDCFGNGMYPGIFRFELSKNLEIKRVRLLGGNDTYSFFGGTCGSYMALCSNVDIEDCEFSYTKNLGENDGCGLDFESWMINTTVDGCVFHDNDSGGILHMQLLDKQHDNLVHTDNLYYANLVNPKNIGYNVDMILYNRGENNVFLRNNHFYTRAYTKAGKTIYVGNHGEGNSIGGTVLENNVTKTLDDYRMRFSFLKDAYTEFFSAADGSLSVSSGIARLTADGKKAELKLNLPVNAYAYNDAYFGVESGRGNLYIEYKDSDGNTHRSGKIKVDGKNIYKLPFAKNEVSGIIRDFTVVFEPSDSNGTLELGFIQLLPEIKVSLSSEGNVIYASFHGKSSPMLAMDINESLLSFGNAELKINGVEKLNYNTLRIETDRELGKKELDKLVLEVSPELFTQYIGDFMRGLDLGRTAAEDSAAGEDCFVFEGMLQLSA